ncbi:1997_t:CDS:10 [Paraglomus occultum]|uniref:Protein transport protein sec16 n=1 Tax=Paraglomus occultum TaxID=144539 RepID=A0A9N8Z9G7_9GLOM|nr:1997_t:CDS:10 [Paraglomus occultum]
MATIADKPASSPKPLGQTIDIFTEDNSDSAFFDTLGVDTEEAEQPSTPTSIPLSDSVSTQKPSSPSPSTLPVQCPFPGCTGENKPKAKFCCECGRSLGVASRAGTPSVNVSAASSPTVGYNNQGYAQFYMNPLASHSSASFTQPMSPTMPYGMVAASYSTASLGQPLSPTMPYAHQEHSFSSTSFIQPLPSAYDGMPQAHDYNRQSTYGYDALEPVQDILERHRGCPIVAFGFGGQLLTMFPRTVQRFTSTGGDMPVTKAAPGAITIRTLKDVVPSSDILSFPGPLLLDNNKGGIKAKRKELMKYLDDNIQVQEDKINSFAGDELNKSSLEATILVWKLLKLMIEHDGALVGNPRQKYANRKSPKIEEAVRNLLVPMKDKTGDGSTDNFTIPADVTAFDANGITETERKTITYTVSGDSVDKLQEMLLRGDRAAAVNYAMQENLWPHAMIIASCVNKDTWKNVVSSFIRQELSDSPCDDDKSNGRESLRVLYSLLSGQGRNAVKEFLPHTPLLRRVSQVPTTPVSALQHLSTTPQGSPTTSMPYSPLPTTPRYSPETPTASFESLSKWRETLAMILANHAPGDSQAITGLGDILRENGWICAAHVCYMLSPQSSTHSGIDIPNCRMSLLSGDYLHQQSTFFQNGDAIRLTEIYEFARSLQSDNDGCLPFLQAYKLLYAWWLIDYGHVDEARRYCESIANTVKVYTKGSQYFHHCFLQNLKKLTQRLLEHNNNNTNNGNNEQSSWLFAKKMPKARLDSLWDSLEGKFNKFVAGDTNDAPNKKQQTESAEVVGPFSHFSSTAHPSASGVIPTRSASASDFRTTDVNQQRSATPSAIPQKQVFKHHRRSSTPGTGIKGMVNGLNGPNVVDTQNSMAPVPESAQATYVASPTDERNGYFGFFGRESLDIQDANRTMSPNGVYGGYNGQSAHNGYDGQQPIMYDQSSAASGYSYSTEPKTDTSGRGHYPRDSIQSDTFGSGEFISPMGNATPFTPAISTSFVANVSTNNNASTWNNDDDDLGLGNNSLGGKKKRETGVETEVADGNEQNANENTVTGTVDEKPKEEKNEQEKKADGRWFSRWFAKKETTAKTANLGEENSFYYDPVQKRWVNKKVEAESPSTLMPPPPPPTRARTTSPTPSESMNKHANRVSLPPAPYPNGLPGISATPPPGGQRKTGSGKRHKPRYVNIMDQI